MKFKFSFLLAGFFLLTTPRLFAGSFKILGPRATGTGGAFVAVAEGSLASYWNPAALAFDPGFRVGLPASGNLEATGGILNSAKKISDSASSISKLQVAQKEGKAVGLNDLKTFSEALVSLKEMEGAGKGLQADVSGGANARVGRWSVTVNNFVSVGVDPIIDVSGIYLGSATVAAAGSSVFNTLPFRALSSENLAGIDLSVIAASTAAPSGFEAESASLASSVQSLADGAGVKLGNLSSKQIANALINLASAQGVSPGEIRDAVRQIGEAMPLLLGLISGKTFRENNSNLTIRGVSLTEISVGHGREISEFGAPDFLRGLAVGANIKYILAQTAYSRQYFLREGDETKLDGLSSVINENTRQSSALALDLGVLWRRDDILFKPRAGFVGKNINSPKFAMPTAAVSDGYSDYTLDSQWRFGVAVKPLNFWLVACDADITTNKTEISGYDSRNISVGSELNIVNRKAFNMALRAGLVQNLAFSGSPLTYTAGMGLNLLGFNMDMAGAMSADKVAVGDNLEMPSRAMASLSLSFNF
ncbi:MAG: conjugal transfer protein TraF [Endomicrobiia bacterium]|nr:conjugal transfer protein TraF [Endomicrobiia bacterium]